MKYWIIPVVSLIFLTFFSGIETALSASGRLRSDPERNGAPFPYRILRRISGIPGHYPAFLLLGYTFLMVTCIFFSLRIAGTATGSPVHHGAALLLTGIPALALLVVAAGIIFPRIMSAIFPDPLLSVMVLPFSLLYLLLSPVSLIVLWFMKSTLFLFRQKHSFLNAGNPLFLKAGFENLLQDDPLDQTDNAPEEEKEVILFRNALDFSKVKLREIMVPRNEIEVLDINSDIEALRRKFVETGFSRILFYEGNKDNIVGYVHTTAIFQKAQQIKPFLKNVLIVPETMAANRLLRRFIKEHRSIALVVDEFGGTAGLVTSEDILEEIFGEIEDEHDTDDFTGKKINDRQYVLSGRFEIDALNEKYRLNIPESDFYETLAGFILYHLESIPKVNEIITIGKLNFKIVKATRTKIEMVVLTVSDD